MRAHDVALTRMNACLWWATLLDVVSPDAVFLAEYVFDVPDTLNLCTMSANHISVPAYAMSIDWLRRLPRQHNDHTTI